ncbi:MAG: DnaD domain protein [Clostridia bacterium]|nr:DnaD domain protein [Clostridia bacterium]
MAFCKFSSEIGSTSVTIVENAFIEQYLPYSSGEQVRIYLWGLYLCGGGNSLKSSLETLDSFAQNLGISSEDVLKAFKFWQEQGLVQIVETTPIQIEYLPVKNAISKKKFKVNKYEQFNLQAQTLIAERMITPNEFSEYYTLLESFHMSPEALLMIIKYCVDVKGKNVGYSYILTVAKNWANEGLLTFAQVEQKLQELINTEATMKEIFKALGSVRKSTLDEKQKYIKWTKDFDFSDEVIIFVASMVKKGGFDKLDSRLSKYYELHLMSVREIKEYETNKNDLYGLAKEINKTIGVYYENLENVVESYINPWLMRGYDENSLKLIASYCFKNGVRNLQGMDSVVQKYYKRGLTTTESIIQQLEKAKAQDDKIKAILEKANLIRNVTSWDRDFYKTWVYSWNMPQEVIEYAATLSADKTQPMQYINKILSNWFEQKINTLDSAKTVGELYKTGAIDPTKDKSIIHDRTYSKEEFESLISDIDEIEI